MLKASQEVSFWSQRCVVWARARKCISKWRFLWYLWDFRIQIGDIIETQWLNLVTVDKKKGTCKLMKIEKGYSKGEGNRSTREIQKISNMRVQFVALAIVKILVIQFIRYCTQPFIENTKWYCHQSRNRTVVEDRFISYGKNNTKDSWNLRLVVVACSLK